MYIGVGEGGGVHVDFDTIHLKHIPPPYTHLNGLLEMFKGKIRVR